MKIKSKFIILLYAIFFVLVYENLLLAKRLFVLNPETGIVTEYNPVDLITKNQIKIPEYEGYERHWSMAYRFRPPTKDLLVNKSGHILYYKDSDKHHEFNGRKFKVRRVCYWNGKKWDHAEVSYHGGTYFISVPFLDEKENVFYWYINSGIESNINRYSDYASLYINNDFELYRFSFQHNLVQERIIKIIFDECLCNTGACEETCPIGRISTSKGIIKDIIPVEHFVMGQLKSEIIGTTYYAKHGKKWLEQSKSEIQNKLFLKIIEDGGCCGWENDSSDRLLVDNGKQNFIIYDEHSHFNNQNYDISFYIFNAELSLDMKRVAYTIMPCCKPFNTIRVSSNVFDASQGKEYVNLEDQKEIKTVLNTLPLVEVSTIDVSPRVLATIKNAILSGWIDNDRLLLIKDNKLAIFNLLKKDIQESSIQVEFPHQVYLR